MAQELDKQRLASLFFDYLRKEYDISGSDLGKLLKQKKYRETIRVWKGKF